MTDSTSSSLWPSEDPEWIRTFGEDTAYLVAKDEAPEKRLAHTTALLLEYDDKEAVALLLDVDRLIVTEPDGWIADDRTRAYIEWNLGAFPSSPWTFLTASSRLFRR